MQSWLYSVVVPAILTALSIKDAGGLMPAKDDNTALHHFAPRTLPIFKCVGYYKLVSMGMAMV